MTANTYKEMLQHILTRRCHSIYLQGVITAHTYKEMLQHIHTRSYNSTNLLGDVTAQTYKETLQHIKGVITVYTYIKKRDKLL